MDPLKSAKAVLLLRGFMVFVTIQPWTFQAPLSALTIFYYGNRNARFSDGRKTGWIGSKSRPNPGPQKIG
jgi:hypothetical protein